MQDTRLTFGEQVEQLLGHRDYHMVTHALRVAAKRFDQDAANCEKAAIQLAAWEKQNPGRSAQIMTARGAAMSAEHFRRQAADTRAILARFEDSDD